MAKKIKERTMEIKAKHTFSDKLKKVGAVALAVAASPIPGLNVVAGVAAGRICKGVDDELEIAEAEAKAAAETGKVVEAAKQAPVEAEAGSNETNTEETR